MKKTDDGWYGFGDHSCLQSHSIGFFYPFFTPFLMRLPCLGIAYNTVLYHRKNLYSKLGIHSMQELFALAERRVRSKEKRVG
jgi:hypothetical protein